MAKGDIWIPNHMLSDKTCVLGPFINKPKEGERFETFIVEGKEWYCLHNATSLNESQMAELKAWVANEVARLKLKQSASGAAQGK